MQWIILLVIAAVVIAVLFFRGSGQNNREAVLPRDSLRRKVDTEFAEEPVFDRERLVPEWEIVGLREDDERSEDGINVSKEKSLRSLNKKRQRREEEFALEMGQRIETSRLVKVQAYDPHFQPDHVIKIGESEPLICGHDMPIHMQVSPVLTAMPKDPYWAFVYWVLPPDCPSGDWELKVQNLSNGTEYFQRIDPGARRWYLHLNKPGESFVFELGVRGADGIFRRVLTSNRIDTPPDRPSSVIDAEWLSIEEFYRLGKKVNPHGSPAFIMEFGGASEMLFAGASEQLFAGASEQLFALTPEQLQACAEGLVTHGAENQAIGGARVRQ